MYTGDSWWSGGRDGEKGNGGEERRAEIKRERREERRCRQQSTPIFSLDKNQCYKSNFVSSLYT